VLHLNPAKNSVVNGLASVVTNLKPAIWEAIAATGWPDYSVARCELVGAGNIELRISGLEVLVLQFVEEVVAGADG
jgi:hypothetical protein